MRYLVEFAKMGAAAAVGYVLGVLHRAYNEHRYRVARRRAAGIGDGSGPGFRTWEGR